MLHWVDTGDKRVLLDCVKTCADCPAQSEDWQQLLNVKRDCCQQMWIPARFLTSARGKDQQVDYRKALRAFLRALGLVQ